MKNSKILIIAILSFFILITAPLQALSQTPKLKSISWKDNWRIDLKTGFAMLLTEVPQKYIDKINYVNIPTKIPGPAVFLAVRKGISSHFEIGYQFGYININGKVNESGSAYKVKTQGIESNFMFIFNLKNTIKFRPRTNYFTYYRVGGISLNNNPREILPDGSLALPSEANSHNSFNKNIAILTGIGFGMNYQFTNNLSIIGSFEINRSSDLAADIYKFQKIFYQSENTVNNYITTAFGLSYTYNLTKRKQTNNFRARTETEKRLLKYKISKEKKQSNYIRALLWYDRKRGL